MKAILEAVVGALFAALRPRANLFAENLVLRQQFAILRRATPRPRLRPIDRAFWVIVSRLRSRWAECLAIVQPGTVIAWHRRNFARWWAWKSRPVGRPPLAPELVTHRRWRVRTRCGTAEGSPANLRSSDMPSTRTRWRSTCRKPAPRPHRPPSQTYKTFLCNHLAGTIAIDF